MPVLELARCWKISVYLTDQTWQSIKAHEGEVFHTKSGLELTYTVIDNDHIQFSRTAEWVSKSQFQKVYESDLTPAQINKKIRASYYILAVLNDERIR